MDHNHSDDNTIHPVLHNTTHDHDGDDVGSEESPTLTPPVPQLIGLGVLLLCTLGTIAAGYFHGKMHLLTVLKNAAAS
jgi:hypothetical protein